MCERESLRVCVRVCARVQERERESVSVGHYPVRKGVNSAETLEDDRTAL